MKVSVTVFIVICFTGLCHMKVAVTVVMVIYLTGL